MLHKIQQNIKLTHLACMIIISETFNRFSHLAWPLHTNILVCFAYYTVVSANLLLS